MTPNVPLRASLTAGSRRHASGMAAGLGEWQRFAGPRFRAFHAVGFSQGAIGALAGGAVTTPLMLALGAPAAMVLIVAILPGIGSLTQLLMPAVLRRTDGNLRGVTLAISLVGDTRGFWFAAIVALAATGLLTHGEALAAIVVASVIAAP